MKTYGIIGYSPDYRVKQIVESLNCFHNGEQFRIVTLGRKGTESELERIAPSVGNCIVDAVHPPSETVYREQRLAPRLMEKANTRLLNSMARHMVKPWERDVAISDGRILDEIEEFRNEEQENPDRRWDTVSPWQLQKEAVAHDCDMLIVLGQDKTSMAVARIAKKLGREVQYL